jgi:aerobic-type carbon monoxide dehydrogenase small subunit (CoxS/CutS family)
VSAVIVNGVPHDLEGWRGRRLLDFLRDGLGLTGTKEGCGEGECGACTVLVDGEPACSCLLITDTVAAARVTTVEGLDPGFLDRLELAVADLGGVQCGFCTPGFAVMATWLAAGGAGAEPLEKALEGNLCRCTGYVQLKRAIASVLGP